MPLSFCTLYSNLKVNDFRRLKFPQFPDNRYMNVAKLSALHTDRLKSQEISLIPIAFGGWVDPQGHSAAGMIKSAKNPNDPIGNQTRDLMACSPVILSAVILWIQSSNS
jgi:hypothetical protein